MKQRGGGIQISRKVTISLDQANVLDLGPITMVQNHKESKELCAFSRAAYNKLKSYIEEMRSAMQSNEKVVGAINALKMAIVLAALNPNGK